MTHQHLTDLLERAAESTEVGPPPLEELLHGVRRRRRRHAVVGGVVLTVAAVAAAVLVPVLATPRHDDAPSQDLTTTHPPAVSRASHQVDIEGTWIVVALPGWQGRLTVGHRHVWIRFHDGRLVADNGLNTTTGRYVLRGNRFDVRHLSSTAVGSIRPVPPLAERLPEVRTVARDPGGAYLEDARGRVLVALFPR